MRGFGFFILIVVFWLLPTIIKAKKNQQAKGSSAGAANTNAAQRPAPSMKRPTATAAARSAKRDFRAPEAPCIVCEQTGEDHFQRDKVRRLQQLDEWLKIGLIDRSEYLVLRDRYQRGI